MSTCTAFVVAFILTGIFVPLLQAYSSSSSSSSSLSLSSSSSSSSSAAAAALSLSSAVTGECGSTDIRNDCDRLLQLEGCTAIKGFLIITLLLRVNNNTRETCDFEKYHFPALREITDFFLFFDVKGLTTIRDLFPNLTVIRGRRLFMNYALGITSMPNLEVLEFKSLVAIQRGHVYISTCPKLCHLEKINWDRMTLSTGENHIYPTDSNNCRTQSECKGCESEYCWSNLVCQKFENDNVVNLRERAYNCHEQCLGGCYNTTQADCVVCKQFTDHGVCVAECPEDKYSSELHQRCYTQEECVSETEQFTHGFTCVPDCPSGYVPNDDSDCVPCSDADDCVKICQPQMSYETVMIYNLADADLFRGCQILNSSLIINIRNNINEDDLERGLGSVREIRGHLKVVRSPHLTSLKFLKNLRKIAGDPLENEIYAFIIYNNKKLKELWQPENFELERGSMYVQLNNKLCNRFLMEFRDKVVHDRARDSLQISDQEALCGPKKLQLQLQVVSHHKFQLMWPIEQTSDEIEIIYRPIPIGVIFSEDSELDSNVCTRINWQRQLVFKSELRKDGSFYVYTIKGLEPNTKYGCLVKTFGTIEKNDARSELLYATTKMDIPKPPLVDIIRKTDSSLTLQVQQENSWVDGVTHYVVDVYEHPEDVEFLDKRNYCNQPALRYVEAYSGTNRNEDYDDCCARQEEAAEDRVFAQKMRQEFSCTLDRKENCLDATMVMDNKPVQRIQLALNETTFTLHALERFRLYVLQIRACNGVACSSFSMHSERTDFLRAGDKIDDLHACRVSDSSEYRIHFSEPKHPNGLIVSYVIHYRFFTPDDKPYQNQMNCVTRLQHAQSNYQYVVHLNTSYNEVAVRVHSLGSSVITPWVNVSVCHAGPVTKIAGIGVADSRHSHGLNVFLVFFLVGAGGTLLWICYKRRYWCKFNEMRRYLPVQRNWRTLVVRPEASMEDRQILVDGFETVRFHNNPDDDQKYLE